MCHSALVHGAKNVFVHCFLDGRDTPPKSADKYINRLREYLNKLNSHYEGNVQIASIIGRYYAMDRDNRWDRVQKRFWHRERARSDTYPQYDLDAHAHRHQRAGP